MTTTFEDLKAYYDGKDIGAIEREARESSDMAKMSRKALIMALYYLQRTGRWKENKAYKNASFKQYIFDQFALREATYQKERWAYISFPVESEQFGAGVIISAKEKCGNEGIKKVVADLVQAGEGLTRPKIEKIISKHKKPASKKQLPTKRELSAEQDHVRSKLVDEQRVRIETEDQVTKLKATLADRNAQIARITAERDKLRERCAELESEILTIRTAMAPLFTPSVVTQMAA